MASLFDLCSAVIALLCAIPWYIRPHYNGTGQYAFKLHQHVCTHHSISDDRNTMVDTLLRKQNIGGSLYRVLLSFKGTTFMSDRVCGTGLRWRWPQYATSPVLLGSQWVNQCLPSPTHDWAAGAAKHDPVSSLKTVSHQIALRNIMFHSREWSTCLLNWEKNIWLFIYMA